MPIRALFFGTPDFALPTLRVLHEDPAIELCGVVTRPDRPAGRGKQLQPPPVKALAQERNLEIFQPESLKDPAAVEWIRQRSPDVLVVVAYGAFVPTAVREIPPLGCVNLHPSRLPRYRGAAPIQWTLINGETATANTTMYLADGWDDGDIIYQEEEPVRPRDTAGGLAERLAEKGGRLVLRSLVDIAAGVAPRIPQNEAEATFAPQIKNEDARLDWNRPAREIHNRIRGLNPDPGAFTLCQGERWKILRSEVIEENPASPPGTASCPGTIVSTEFNTIRVAARDGIVEILELQPAGKKSMTAASFLRGRPLEPGAACENA